MASRTVQLSLFAALLFIIISSQFVYKLTNGATNKVLHLRLADSAGNPTRAGLVVHGIVFFGLMYAYARANKI